MSVLERLAVLDVDPSGILFSRENDVQDLHLVAVCRLDIACLIEDCVNCCISDLFLCDVETFLLVEDLVVTASINDTDDVCLFESSLLDDLFHCC